MKILILSKSGDSADIGLRMAANGNKVKFWIKEKEYQDTYEGLIDKVKDWRPWVNWCDLIVVDQNRMDDIWLQIHKIKPCFGGSPFATKLEKDRKFAHQLMNQIGLEKIESVSFKTINEAIAHVRQHKVKHVVKPSGPKIESHHVLIGEMDGGEDIIALLYRFKEQRIPYESIEIEERKIGVEVGCSLWFAGHDWIFPININFEHKRFATGAIGFLTGEMGTAMRYDFNPDNVLFKSTLNKMRDILTKENYRGQIDLSFIAEETEDGTKFWPLEFTPRTGYPAIFIEEALQITPIEELFWKTANGEKFQNQVKTGWAIGVVVVTPGFPSPEEVKKRSLETPIFGLNENNAKDIHLVEAKVGFHDKGKEGLVTSNGIGYPFVATGIGETITEAKQQAYKHLGKDSLSRVWLPNAYYRLDIGDRVLEKERMIKRMGSLTEFPYSF